MQPDAYAQPCKRASLSDHPHPSGLPTGRRESHKTKNLPKAVQNKPPEEATDDYIRPMRNLSPQDKRLHITLRCLEGSTMSNLVHRQRRCARIVPLYGIAAWRAVRQRMGISTRRRILLWLQGSLFFTANGSYFVFWGLRRSCKAGLGVAALGCCQDLS